MFTAFFIAFGIGAVIAIVFFLPTLARVIGVGLAHVAIDLPTAALRGIREGVADGNRIADKITGKVTGKPSDPPRP